MRFCGRGGEGPGRGGGLALNLFVAGGFGVVWAGGWSAEDAGDFFAGECLGDLPWVRLFLSEIAGQARGS